MPIPLVRPSFRHSEQREEPLRVKYGLARRSSGRVPFCRWGRWFALGHRPRAGALPGQAHWPAATEETACGEGALCELASRDIGLRPMARCAADILRLRSSALRGQAHWWAATGGEDQVTEITCQPSLSRSLRSSVTCKWHTKRHQLFMDRGFDRVSGNVVHSAGEAAADGRCAMPISTLISGRLHGERCMLDGMVPVASLCDSAGIALRTTGVGCSAAHSADFRATCMNHCSSEWWTGMVSSVFALNQHIGRSGRFAWPRFESGELRDQVATAPHGLQEASVLPNRRCRA